MPEIIWQYLNPGRLTPIRETLARQEELFQQKLDGDPRNYILFAEHESVYTYPPRVAHELDQLCRVRQDQLRAELYPMPEQRGGSITYHGPGQLVCYMIVDLPVEIFGTLGLNKFQNVSNARLRMMLELLDIKVAAKPPELPFTAEGVWVVDRGIPKKLVSQGMCARRAHASQGNPITKYGWSLNIATDLSYFDDIYPCGCDIPMTSMDVVSGRSYSLAKVVEVVAPAITHELSRLLAY